MPARLLLSHLTAAVLIVSGTPATATETPEELAAAVSAGHPEVAAMIKSHPGILTVWRAEPKTWPDVLLRAPFLPGGEWRVHDFRRPQPPVVTPAMADCAGAPPPADAAVLYDGHGTDAFTNDDLPNWIDRGGTLTARAKQYSRIVSRRSFGDIQVQLEFRIPSPVRGDWQYRGNSGLFLMGLYEIQILDSFDNPTFPDGMMGALFGEVPPIANAALPPGQWQCLDVVFAAPRFEGARLVSLGRVTVVNNGVVIQANAAFSGPTHFAEVKPYVAHAAALPLELQDHGDGRSNVSFRNFWARPLASPQ